MNFSEEWDKLKDLKVGQQITTIRWNDYPGKVGNIIPINLKGKLLAKARVITIENLTLSQIGIPLIKFDTYQGMTYDKFFQMMQRWYHNKSDWNGLNSKVNVYYMKIIEVMKK